MQQEELKVRKTKEYKLYILSNFVCSLAFLL
jgi:hypothetical protein